MPAYNESNHILKSIIQVKQQFEAVSADYEIIVVDDGSSDGTGKIVRSLADDKVRVISYEQNQGKGHALRTGFLRVTGEFTFLVDGDSEIRGKELSAYVEALRFSDIAIGSKRHPLSIVRTPVLRKFLSLGFNVLERFLTGVKASDTQAGFKGLKSRVLYRVLPLLSVKRYAFDLEFLAVASLLGFTVRELPVEIKLNALVDVRQVCEILVDTLGIAYRLRIRRWYQKNAKMMTDTYKPIIFP